MKIKQLLLSLCLSISLIVGSFVPCINAHASVIDTLEDFRQKSEKIYTETTGVIFAPIRGAYEYFYDWVNEHKSSYGYNGSSQSDFEDFIRDNYNIDGNNVYINSNVVNALRDSAQDYINNGSIKYVYSYSMDTVKPSIDIDKWNAFVAVMQNNPDKYFTLSYYGQQSYLNMWTGVTDLLYINGDSSYLQANCKLYSEGSTTIPEVTTYSWSSSGQSLSPSTSTNYQPGNKVFATVLDSDRYVNLDNLSVDLGSYQYVAHLNSADIGGSGKQSYYINDSFNTSNINTTYNTTVTDIDNSITIGDINNYIDDYVDTNDRDPSPQEIYIYINNYIPDPDPTPTPTPGPGGGDEPGGGGGDSDPDNIWDFLHEIGEILGNLIATLGEVVAGILSAITSIVSSLITGFPNVIGSLIEYFLPFLPEELITVISLSIILSIIVGIVKLIRG